jgi:hypothetical protein
MSKVAWRSLAFVASITLLSAGCDDEVTTPPDAATTNKDGGTTPGDGGTTPGDTGGGTSVDGGPAVDAAMTTLTAQQARGQYLVDHVSLCPECHTPHNAMGVPEPGKYLAGWKCFIEVAPGVCLSSRNLTNDDTGLKNRTNDEIKNMFMNGIRPPAAGGGSSDGGTGVSALNPVMPYYVFHNMDSDDADAIVAYLRTVTAVPNMIDRRAAVFDVPGPANYLDPNIIPMPKADAPNRESALRGRYLTSKVGLCIECHTEHTPPPMPGMMPISNDPLMNAKLFQGGERFPFPQFPVVPVSKNLTSDEATGLGKWMVSDIVKVLKEGKDRDGKGICPPMPVGPMGAFGQLTYQDTLDIANYIKSLPPATNMIVDMCTFPFGPPPMGDGGAATDAAASDAPAPTDGGSAADTAAAGG